MYNALENIALIPWQSTTIILTGGTTIILFLSALVLGILWSCVHFAKNNVEEKIYAAGYYIFIAFLISLVISNIAVFSFLFNSEFGWKLTLLGCFSAVSFISILPGIFGGMASRNFFIRIVLSILSFSSLIGLGTTST